MTHFDDEQWTLEKFWSLFIDSDQDYVDNALSGLLAYIRKVDYFKEFEKNGETYLSSILNQVLGDSRYLKDQTLHTIFDSTMHLIPQFAAKLPIDLIPVLYNTLFTNISKEGIKFFTVLSNVIEDTIAVAGNYEPERQQAIVNLMMNRLMTFINNESTKQDMKNLSLNLIALTVETLPNCLTPAMISDLKNLIANLSTKLSERKDVETNEFLTMSHSLASVSKVYSTLIKDKEQHEFFDSIEKLENKRLAVYILSIIIEYRPQYFDISDEGDDKHSFVHYQDLIFEQIANPQDVQDFNNAYAIYTVQFIKTLSVLINKFSSKMSEEYLNQYISADFDFLNLGASEQTESEENNEEIQLEADVELDSDDDEQIADSSDESWKIRDAAMKLAISLIEEQPDLFYDTLFYISDDSYMPSYVTTLICDHDIGSQLEAMRFLRIIIHHYKNNIEQEIIDDFEKSLISQIKKDARDQALDSFIRTLTFIIRDLKAAPNLELSLVAIKNITDVYRDNTVDSTLVFITNLLEYSSEIEIIKPIINLINILLSEVKQHMVSTCLTVVSKIYHYYYRICNKESSLQKDLNSLNEAVLKLSQTTGEVRSYAITAISVFVSCCPGLASVQKSVDLITKLLNDNSVAKASAGAIALISASESANTLSKDVKSILAKLKEKIMLEPIITNRALWAITLMLHKNIIGLDDCQDIVGTLFDIANSGEKNARVLSLKILNRLYPKGCDSKKLCLLVQSITSSPLSERIISEIAELVLVSSKSSLDNVKPFVDSLISKVKSNSLGKDESVSLSIVSSLAQIIGVASSTNKDYGLSLISQFKSHINDKGVLQIFALKCIGEIGSLVDLSSTNADLIKTIFELIHNSDRNIFVPASESVGLMSVGSPDKILPQFMNAAKADQENYLTAYLFGIKSFVRKANTIKNRIPKQVFDQIVKSVPVISDFLLSNATDDFKETALTVSECLSGLIGISFDYSKKLVEVATYITVRAIAIYMEEYSSYSYRNSYSRNLTEKEKEEVMSLITQVNSKYDIEKPMLNYAIMLCIKFAITKKLCKELLDNDIVNRCLDGTEIQQSHNLIKTIGTEQVTINIGTQLKSTSLTCIELFIKSDVSDQLEYGDISKTILYSFSQETLFELRQKALDIMTLIATSPLPEAQENSITYLDDNSTTDLLKRFDNVISNDNPPSEVKVSYYTTLVSLLSVKSINPDEERKIKGILARHQNDAILIRIEEENEFKGTGKSDSLYFTNGYTSSRLMEEFYPEAASIFIN